MGLLVVLPGAGAQQALPPPPPIPPTVTIPTTTPVGPGMVAPATPAGPLTRPDAGVILGRVVDGSGRGVPRVVVRLSGNVALETVLTDDKGRFFFRSIPPGEAIVTAEKVGFVGGAFGQQRASGLPLMFTVSPGQVMPDMKIELFKSGVVTGWVTDESGDPVVGTRVVAMRRQFENGQWLFVPAGADDTDDQGGYRIFDLVPGQYIFTVPATSYSVPAAALEEVSSTGNVGGGIALMLNSLPGDTGEARANASVRLMRPTADGKDIVWSNELPPPNTGERETVYVSQYYPFTDRRVLAMPVDVLPGDVRYGVDFQLKAAPIQRVIGRLVGDPETVGNQLIRLVPADVDSAGLEDAATTVSRSDGSFTFRRVPAGDYRLEAGNPTPVLQTDPKDTVETVDATEAWARADVKVRDEDVNLMDISMHRTSVVAGFIVFEREQDAHAANAAMARIPITIVPAEPGVTKQMEFHAAHTFGAKSVIPGEYYVRIGRVPPGWNVASIVADGHDAMDAPFDLREDGASITVTLSTRGTEITGNVRDSRGQLAAGATIIMLPISPEGRTVWTPGRTRETRVSTTGTYVVRGLPPGDYLAIAIDDAVAENWQDDRVIAALRTLATRFSLRALETRTLNLRVSPLRR